MHAVVKRSAIKWGVEMRCEVWVAYDVTFLCSLVEVLPPSLERVEQLDLTMTLRVEPVEEGRHLQRVGRVYASKNSQRRSER